MSDYTRALQAENGLNVNASPWTGPVAVQLIASTPPPAVRPPPAVTPQQPMYAAQPMDVAPNMDRPPCKFFLTGGCTRGASCNFAHELPRDSTLSSNADGTTNVTGIVFNMNAKNTYTALQRQSSAENLQALMNGQGQDPNGVQDPSTGLYYDAAYTAQYMWEGADQGYPEMGMYGGYPNGGEAYYGEAHAVYGGQAQHVTPPPQAVTAHQYVQHVAYQAQQQYTTSNGGGYQHVFAQQATVQQQGAPQGGGGGYWDSFPTAALAQHNPGSTPPQEPPLRPHGGYLDPQQIAPSNPTTRLATFAATVAPTRTIPLPAAVAWGERHPSPNVNAHVEALLPEILGTKGGNGAIAGPSVRLQGNDIVTSLHRLMQDKSPPKPVGHVDREIDLAPSPLVPPAPVAAPAPPPPTTVTAVPPPSAGKKHPAGNGTATAGGRGRGYGGQAYHAAGT